MFLRNYFRRNKAIDYPLRGIQTEIPEAKDSELYEEKIQASDVNFFERLTKTILHNHIYLYLKTSDLINVIGNHQLQAEIGKFIGEHGYRVCEVTALYRQHYTQLHHKKPSRRKNFYLLCLFLLASSSTGLNAYFTSKVFINNKDLLMQLADEYSAPRDDAAFIPYDYSSAFFHSPHYGTNQSCEERLHYITSYDKIVSYEPKDCTTKDLYTNNCVTTCVDDDYLYKQQTNFNERLATSGAEECHRIFLDLQTQKCAPLYTVPPYLMSASFAFAGIVAYYYYKLNKATRSPNTWEDFIIVNSDIIDQVAELLNKENNGTAAKLEVSFEQEDREIVKNLKIDDTLRLYNSRRLGLFQKSSNKTYLKPSDEKMEKQRQQQIKLGL